MTQAPGHSGEGVFAFPLSYAQERLWFMEQISPGTSMFNLNNAVRLAGRPAPRVLARAIEEIVRRHEVLRSAFRVIDGRPLQVVFPTAPIAVSVLELGSSADPDRALGSALLAEAGAPFELGRCPLFRVAVLPINGHEYVLSLTMHHLISDGWSLGLFWQELSALSDAFRAGRPITLPKLPIQYGDFAVWQRGEFEGGALASQMDYWREQLRDLPHLEVPTDRPRPPVQSFVGRHHELRIDTGLTAAIRELARDTGATTFMVLLAVFQALLGRYTQQDDVAIGSYVAGRSPAEVEGLIGLFLNTVILRADLSGAPTFRCFLDRVRTMTLDAYANQDVPFAKLVEALHPERNLSINPLFQVVFQLINVPTLDGRGANRKPLVDVELGTSLFDLTCTLWETDREIRGHLEYNSDLFSRATIAKLADHFEALLRSVVSDPDSPLETLPMMSPAERHWLLGQARGADRPVDSHDGIVLRFAERVAASPDAIAFVCDGVRQSYRELAGRVHELARLLREAGVRPRARVGVCLDRSLDSVAAMLAVFSAEGVYVPLNPSEGAERLEFIVGDAALGAVIVDSVSRRAFPSLPGPFILTDEHTSAANGRAGRVDTTPRVPDPSETACVLYTSGSTGRPKGAAVSHREILGRLDWMWRAYPFRPGDRGSHKTAISFIDSLWEVLGPLLAGFPSVIVPEQVAADPHAFVSLLAAERVTHIWLVPSLLRALLLSVDGLGRRLPDLRFWVSSGEALRREIYDQFAAEMPHAVLFNLYGTSEVWDATWWDPRSSEPARGRVPIGKPIENRSAYVLDRHLEPCPIGVPGELYIGGIEPAQGYVTQPILTARRFVPNPFAERPGERLFRTMDRARVLTSGDIEILGRADHELKIRGFRVDLGELEETLERHPSVQEVAVVMHRSDGNSTLVAHVVVSDSGLTPTELRRYLKERVPGHVVPAAYRFHRALPLTGTGKLDREALARAPVTYEDRGAGLHREEPRGPLEEALYRVWREVLPSDELGVTDNFFDVGGHSLLLFQIHARLRQMWPARTSMSDLFRYPTIRALADFLQDGDHTAASRADGCDVPTPADVGVEVPI